MTTQEKMSEARLAQKIRWEGGLFAALDYGIRPNDIADPELAALWDRLLARYSELAPLLEEAMTRLDVAA